MVLGQRPFWKRLTNENMFYAIAEPWLIDDEISDNFIRSDCYLQHFQKPNVHSSRTCKWGLSLFGCCHLCEKLYKSKNGMF